MFRVIVKRPSVPVGTKGYKKQQIGIFMIDKDGVEDDFPSRVDVMRGPEDKDYAPGEYTVHPCSFAVKSDDFGGQSLQLGRLVLVPATKEAGRKAA